MTGDRVTVPAQLLHPRGGDHYVLRVVGDSMEEEAICDGDYVIVLRRETAEPGEMIVAHYGDEASIKRYYPINEHEVQLQSGNKKRQPIILPASEVRIQGVVVGIMRKFQ